MKDIQIFNHPQFGEVRTSGTSDAPMFCLADLCRVLEIANVTDTRKRLSQDGLDSIEVIDSIGRRQSMYFVNEKNLYKVIMRSDKPQAEPFQDWVCGEVLPTIRKHGAYMTEQTMAKALSDPDFIIQLATSLKEEQRAREEAEQRAAYLRMKNEDQTKQIEASKPKVVFADAMVGSTSSILIGQLAKVLKQNGVDMGQNRLFQWMRDNHYLGSYGSYYNIPYQAYIEQGLFEIKHSIHSEHDKMVTTCTTKVTGKGQQYFINLFLNKRP